MDVSKAVADAKAGKLEYRTDRGGNVHLPIGKRSFAERALLENYAALVEEIVRAKPSAAKGRYITKITLTTTMGPGIHVDSTITRDIAEELTGESAGAESPKEIAKVS
jgi:large subunit ribosomal protein L1